MDKIKIAYNPDFAPFSKMEGGEARGLVIDRLKKYFEASSVQCEFVPTPLPALTLDLESGKVDAIAALGITDERKKRYVFSKSIIVSGGAWFIPKKHAVISDGEFPKSAVTPIKGPLYKEIKQKYPEIELVDCEDYADALEIALSGKVEAAALNWHVGRMMVKDNYAGKFHLPKSPYNTVALGLAVLKENHQYVERLNKTIPDDLGYDPAE